MLNLWGNHNLLDDRLPSIRRFAGSLLDVEVLLDLVLRGSCVD